MAGRVSYAILPAEDHFLWPAGDDLILALSYTIRHGGSRESKREWEEIRLIPRPEGRRGPRWRALCPGCGKHAQKLYMPARLGLFLCRHCHRLSPEMISGSIPFWDSSGCD